MNCKSLKTPGGPKVTAGALSRRAFLIGAPLTVAGCQANGGPPSLMLSAVGSPHFTSMYAALPKEHFPIPAVNLTRFDPKYLRQEVAFKTSEIVGTIIVDTSGPFLFLVRPDGKALRYGIGVGREGFAWAGQARILMKRVWPTWTPPAAMIVRQPELEPYRNGMAPGLENPLGARALYLFENGRDTLYRIHGTNEPRSIGKHVSSGCVRLLNQDIIDLHLRVPRGTKVIVQKQSKHLLS